MKTTKKTITRISAALLTMACMASTAAAVSAESASAGIAAVPASVASASLSSDTNVQKLIRQRESQLQKLKNKKKEIHVSNYGWYSAKSMKLYGRRATGVDSNGNFILGKWEQLHTTTSARGLGGGYYITISGDYVNFAFSYDIVGGTDFPYSGVFWTRSHDTDWDRINIHLSGSCRMADVSIYIGEEKVVGVTNCGSHSEWKP
ncbi:MAG: hypothetical protein J6I96_02520 [Oscillospiraceae bacterium]|nr:hypothetical protein [Oscillospiraceae bacterium]